MKLGYRINSNKASRCRVKQGFFYFFENLFNLEELIGVVGGGLESGIFKFFFPSWEVCNITKMIFSTSSGGICKLTIEGLASRIVDTRRTERYPFNGTFQVKLVK